LRDPETDAVRYVGKTFYRLDVRLDGHLKNPTNEAMAKWVQSLGDRKPIIQEIEEVSPSYNWPAREKFWIEYYLYRGCDLLNVQSGGLSGRNLRSSTKWRQEQRESRKTTRKKSWVQKKVCPTCGDTFITMNRNQIYCKPYHPATTRPTTAHPSVTPVEREKVCPKCGKTFKTIYPNQKYCVSYHRKPLHVRNCISCGRVFETNIANQARCQPSCRLDKVKPAREKPLLVPFKTDPRVYGWPN